MTLTKSTYDLKELFEDIFRLYGYDFREYSESTAVRRIRRRMALNGLATMEDLKQRVFGDADFADRLIKDFSINVTEMFRDPEFFSVMRQRILPLAKGRSFLKIWHAGCATGEEAYSMAILLAELGLYETSRIYATDFNAAALHQARMGIFPLARMRSYITNYLKAGGENEFADYYTAGYDGAVIKNDLKSNIVFSRHDLSRDDSFSEVQVIVCRNVLIYFNRSMQEKIFDLFFESLEPGGFLCLGSKETIRFCKHAEAFSAVDESHRIYRKAFPHDG